MRSGHSHHYLSSPSLLGAQQNRDSVQNNPASLLAVSLGKMLNGMPPSLCGRQVAGPSSLPVVVATVLLKTCNPSVGANAVRPIYTSSCMKLTKNSSNDEKSSSLYTSRLLAKMLKQFFKGNSVLICDKSRI